MAIQEYIISRKPPGRTMTTVLRGRSRDRRFPATRVVAFLALALVAACDDAWLPAIDIDGLGSEVFDTGSADLRERIDRAEPFGSALPFATDLIAESNGVLALGNSFPFGPEAGSAANVPESSTDADSAAQVPDYLGTYSGRGGCTDLLSKRSFSFAVSVTITTSDPIKHAISLKGFAGSPEGVVAAVNANNLTIARQPLLGPEGRDAGIVVAGTGIRGDSGSLLLFFNSGTVDEKPSLACFNNLNPISVDDGAGSMNEPTFPDR